jgi:hypothetical protein
MCMSQARRAWRALAVAAVAAVFAVHGDPASTQPAPASPADRCWYVIQETVVPVNLPKVSVVVAGAQHPSLRKVTIRELASPKRLVTEFFATPERVDELLQSLAQRRHACSGGSP